MYDETTDAGPISPLVRAAVFVADLQRSRSFYTALGLTDVYFEGELAPGSANAVLGQPASVRTRCVILKAPGGALVSPNFGMLGLFELSDPAPAPLARPDQAIRAGETALVFYVGAAFDAALDRCRALGGRPLSPPVLFEMPHASQREVLVRDPDGVLVNLIARPPAQAFETASVKS